MLMYQDGYECYKQASREHGLEPVNFHYFITSLSQEQLDAYNESASYIEGCEKYES